MALDVPLAGSRSVAAQNAGDMAGKRHRRRDSATLTVGRISTHAEALAIFDAWRELYVLGAPQNPFASPDWLLPWARHFVPERNLAMLTVRRRGQLVGLAPWYIKRGPLHVSRLQLLGIDKREEFTELPQILTAPGEARSVLRAVMGEWSRQSGEWDWLAVPVMDDQGWLDPEWLTGAVAERGFIQHKAIRAPVVLDLPSDVFALHAGMKRNLRESTHRGRNRLNKTGRFWAVTVHEHERDIAPALSVLARLHSARAQLAGRRRHPDRLARAASREFLEEALVRMARRREAQILTLDVEGEPIAAQLVLMGPDGTFLGPSGIDPAWWGVSAVTLLHLHAAEEAVRRGHSVLNFSEGPSTYKLRWSEQVRRHPEFVVCGPRRSSHIAFLGYRLAATAAGVHHATTRQRGSMG
jgi:CelD/BcsL family acetyltransferase involved in cellulose biosynthesis